MLLHVVGIFSRKLCCPANSGYERNEDCLMSLTMSLIQIKLTLEQIFLLGKKKAKENPHAAVKEVRPLTPTLEHDKLIQAFSVFYYTGHKNKALRLRYFTPYAKENWGL